MCSLAEAPAFLVLTRITYKKHTLYKKVAKKKLFKNQITPFHPFFDTAKQNVKTFNFIQTLSRFPIHSLLFLV